jgi:dinuclear metal center YbgI/SA1388 family protein
MKVGEVLNILDEKIIPSVKWKNDPSGLLIGDRNSEVKKIMTVLNPTLAAAKEAKKKGCNLIVSHHPLFKKPVGSLVEGEYYSDIIRFFIKNDISLISCHTDYDLLSDGVSFLLAKELGLKNIKPLVSIKDIPDVEVNELYKLCVYCPDDHAEKIKAAISKAGGGTIGKYDHCFFSVKAEGNFRPLEGSDPFTGKKGQIEKISEVKIETVVTQWNKDRVFIAVKEAHPYEEPVIDLYPLDNNSYNFGLGAVGELKKKMTLKELAGLVSEKLGTDTLRIAVKDGKEKISRIAVCGGSGASLWKQALIAGAGVFVTSEFNHHLYQEASYYLNIIDATHHSTEQFAKNGLKEYLKGRTGIIVERSDDDLDVVKALQEL